MDFYPVGGDPKELMAYMVKSGSRGLVDQWFGLRAESRFWATDPGLLPGRQSIFKRDVPKKQAMVNQVSPASSLPIILPRFPPLLPIAHYTICHYTILYCLADAARILPVDLFSLPADQPPVCCGRNHKQSSGVCSHTCGRGVGGPAHHDLQYVPSTTLPLVFVFLLFSCSSERNQKPDCETLRRLTITVFARDCAWTS